MAWGKFKIAKLYNIIRSGSKTERKIRLKVCLCGEKMLNEKVSGSIFGFNSPHIYIGWSFFSHRCFFLNLCINHTKAIAGYFPNHQRKRSLLVCVSLLPHCSRVYIISFQEDSKSGIHLSREIKLKISGLNKKENTNSFERSCTVLYRGCKT